MGVLPQHCQRRRRPWHGSRAAAAAGAAQASGCGGCGACGGASARGDAAARSAGTPPPQRQQHRRWRLGRSCSGPIEPRPGRRQRRAHHPGPLQLPFHVHAAPVCQAAPWACRVRGQPPEAAWPLACCLHLLRVRPHPHCWGCRSFGPPPPTRACRGDDAVGNASIRPAPTPLSAQLHLRRARTLDRFGRTPVADGGVVAAGAAISAAADVPTAAAAQMAPSRADTLSRLSRHSGGM